MSDKLVLDGAEYDLIALDDFRMRELREFQKIADIGFEEFVLTYGTRGRYHAGSVLAWTALSIQRAKPQMMLDQIVARLDDLTFEEMNQVWEKVGQSPPAEETSSDSEEETKTSSADSGEPSEPTPESSSQNASGDPESDTGPGSLRAISAG